MKINKRKSPKLPFAFRAIRAAFGFLNVFIPALAKKWAVHLFFKPLRFPLSSAELEIEKSGNSFTTQASGKLIKGMTWGEGPVILLVHGWSGRGGQLWKFVTPLVQKGYKVVAFDAPAHGQSEGSETNIFEWNEMFQKIPGMFGEIEAVISHSFGGIATLFAMTQGIKIKKLVMIGTPTIASELFSEFLRRINGGEHIRPYFYSHIQKKFGVNFDDFGCIEMIKQLPDLRVLLVHDEDDNEVSIDHPQAFLKAKPDSEILFTKGLGHHRILKDGHVIQKSIEFTTRVNRPIVEELELAS